MWTPCLQSLSQPTLLGKTAEVSELIEITNITSGCSDCGFNEATERMKSDADDHGFQTLTYQEITDSVQGEDM
jgi:hypothetical protein